MSNKKRNPKVTKFKRIEMQIKVLYQAMETYRDVEYKLIATGDRMFHRIYQLEQIIRGGNEEDGK